MFAHCKGPEICLCVQAAGTVSGKCLKLTASVFFSCFCLGHPFYLKPEMMKLTTLKNSSELQNVTDFLSAEHGHFV